MNEHTIFNGILIGWSVLAIIVFIALFFIAAPYGRHIRRGWGHTINNRLGWVFMEAPSPLVFAILFIVGGRFNVATVVFLLMWEAHYVHRAFIYPWGLRGPDKRMPLAVMSFGIFFNIMNAYINGRYVFTLSDRYSLAWLTDPRFLAGLLVFITGYVINRQTDHVLRYLRQPGESDYKVSNKSFFRWVSSPNYLGEIVIWVGWALATWSLPGLVFAAWTIANLAPRAKANHAWYRSNFPDYPSERKALIPGVW
jgi:3-oxo-5-alpha-steroid 4-dehydrogenase 1